MSVEFTKKELEFINIYNLCTDTKNSLHDKFEIVSSNEGTTFTQVSDKCTLITVFDKKSNEEFQSIYVTPQVTPILACIHEEEVITFGKGSMSFGKNKYKFNEDQLTLNDISEIKNIIKSESYKEKFSFTNLKNINSVKNYIGDDGLDTVVNIEGHFVASNEKGISAIIKSDNKDNFYIPEILINIILNLKLEEIEVEIYDNFIVSKIKDTYVVIPIKEYAIPNIFEQEYAEKYNHKDKVVVDKVEFIKALQRIKVVASENTYSRIFIYCNEDHISIESKDNNEAVEIVTAEVDKDLVGSHFIVSANYLYMIVSSLEGTDVIIHSTNDVDIVAVKITCNIGNKFYIHCIYPDIEVQ